MSKEIIIGIDEAGRGALAGPVFVGLVVLDPDNPIAGLKDSKVLTPKRRAELAIEIRNKALYYTVDFCDQEEIDELNILEATKKATRKCLYKLFIHDKTQSKFYSRLMDNVQIKIDGNINLAATYPDNLNIECIIRGDSIVPEIMAAGILAKVNRDRVMSEYDRFFPGYDFAKSKGYCSPKHLEGIAKQGICDIHRKTFAKVKEHVL